MKRAAEDGPIENAESDLNGPLPRNSDAPGLSFSVEVNLTGLPLDLILTSPHPSSPFPQIIQAGSSGFRFPFKLSLPGATEIGTWRCKRLRLDRPSATSP